ncbi:MAG TPA: N-6 DNA methylase [Ktedonobacteraceae bacterium]|nr:N-6 DNA methylase [Ktedonobacteraceae bacterium]
MAVPETIVELIERFDRNRSAYKSDQYNEARLRIEFLNPFFAALGWDINNKQGYAEAYKDVIYEDAIKIGGATKAPDYCFRIGGTRKFFVEAKKPSVNLKDASDPAFQLRRYAWSAKLPLSILTDFEEFAIYDCRVKPDREDRAATARIMYLPYTDYVQRWDEIASIFSREAILKGSFDTYAEATRGKRGTSEVDAAFLQEIESWREMLARHLALRNKTLSQRELNFAVQMTIDRIIFLRICEDRGIEEYERLKALLKGSNVYQRLCTIFQEADDRYNSGLFHFQKEKDNPEAPDTLTLSLVIDDKPLKDIFKRLYYPESPYEFSVLPVVVLGQVYEQFLGKVIRLTSSHHVEIEEKPEVRKAGGVFYTPTFIVDYIVQNTLSKLLEGKKPGVRGSASKIKIVDPSCGSGSFLIGAYQYLLDWHRDRYIEEGTDRHRKELYQGAGGQWLLTTQEKKRILLNNIYGVDIDPQAVEVTKLSLLLKVLEGESNQSLVAQLSLFKERALPDLDRNIKCGNSLIGTDFYDIVQMSFMNEEERYRINVFDWHTEFPEIMNSGGFDAVIGNPPYIRMETFKDIKAYLKANYACHDERSDLYAYFLERGHKLLNSQGRLGMIVSNKFLRANYGKPLRDFLSKHVAIEQIVDFAGLPVFVGATIRTIILLTSHDKSGVDTVLYSPPPSMDKFSAIKAGSLSIDQAMKDSSYEFSAQALSDTAWSFTTSHEDAFLTRLRSSYQPLVEYCDGHICMGIKSGLTEAFVINEQTRAEILASNPEADEIIKPFLNGRDVRRYHIEPQNIYLLYTYHGINMARYPAVEQYLKPFKGKLEKRATKQKWYELQQPQYKFKGYMENPKIIFPDIAVASRFALDEAGYYSANTTYFIPLNDLYLLGLLNSRLGLFYFAKTCAGLEGKTETYLRFFGQYLEGFPIPRINPSNSQRRNLHERIEGHVKGMLTLQKQLRVTRSGQDKTMVQRQIDATDRQIDRLVYELYGLTEEEIRMVEGKVQD